jgi:fatty acid amide hydrolase 2
VELHGSRHWVDAARGRGDHTLPVLITAALERLNRHMPEARIRKAVEAARALREEMKGILGGDGILLHPPHPRVAPRHGATVGRAWVLTPAAVFNLLGLPVTEVPLGLNSKGLPLGVQVAAADGNDHLTIGAALALERRFGGWSPPA